MSRTVIAPYPTASLTCSTEGIPAEIVTAAAANAVGYLWALSGRRVGRLSTIEERIRPACSSECGTPYRNSRGNWTNGGNLNDARSCCRVEIFRQPVRSITEVRVEGVVQAPASYTLEENSLLRIGECWPCPEDCDPAPIEVDYESGIDPNAAVMDELICEMLTGFSGDACKLPSRLVGLSRQGVTMDLGDPAEFSEAGLTGLPVTDAYIRSVNPNKLKQRSRVLSPDLSRSVR